MDSKNYKSQKIAMDFGPLIGSLKELLSSETTINAVFENIEKLVNNISENINNENETIKQFLEIYIRVLSIYICDKTKRDDILSQISMLELGIACGFAEPHINNHIKQFSQNFDSFVNNMKQESNMKKRKFDDNVNHNNNYNLSLNKRKK